MSSHPCTGSCEGQPFVAGAIAVNVIAEVYSRLPDLGPACSPTSRHRPRPVPPGCRTRQPGQLCWSRQLVAILRWQLLIGLRPLLSLLLVWDRDIQGKDRCGDHGCWGCDPPGAAVMVLEGWESEHRQREQQAEPGSDHTDPMADPRGDVFLSLLRNSGRRVRWPETS